MTIIKSAVLPVAGLGTRFLPVTKAIPKELLPIVNKPLIQYAVDEAIEAGIEKLIIITSPHKRAIKDYFSRNTQLEKALMKIGKADEASIVRNVLPRNIQYTFVEQREQLGLGHAILCAKKEIGMQPFAVLLADELLFGVKKNATKELINSFKTNGRSQLSVMPVEAPDISNYGVIVPGEGRNAVEGIIEKPSPELAPSNLASIGRYILTSDIFRLLEMGRPGLGGELQLSDAINSQASLSRVEYLHYTGARFDCGTLEGFLQAIKFVANLMKVDF
jgi:UTP--glucose-1-phosphate uridylyltransferase